MRTLMTDEELIRQYLHSGTNSCLEALYNRYSTKVYHRCMAVIRDTNKAQDYTHDIFIRIFARLDRFQERSSFATWLYSIAYNYCVDQLRADKRLMLTALDSQTDYHSYTTEEADGYEYNLQLLSKVMKTMPDNEARLLRLKYQEGLDIRQIASQLNINDSAVKMRLKRSRERAKRLYQGAVC
ncbi:RNA polymerase sigma factor [Rudanella paleaurantiibacter]|nr:RNA polymerase sigma factor [Rudanella paleaurantiibacter]